MLGGQAGAINHVRLGKGAMIGATSAVMQSVDPGSFVSGHPAIQQSAWRKAAVLFRQLPMFKKRVEDLDQRIAGLEEKLAACQLPSDR